MHDARAGCYVALDQFVLGFFFFNDTATTEIYTLSLHDALPICSFIGLIAAPTGSDPSFRNLRLLTPASPKAASSDRKSTRLNSSHANISYAVFCLKKKKNPKTLGLTRRPAAIARGRWTCYHFPT